MLICTPLPILPPWQLPAPTHLTYKNATRQTLQESESNVEIMRVHSFIQQTFVKHLLCVRHSRCYGEQDADQISHFTSEKN